MVCLLVILSVIGFFGIFKMPGSKILIIKDVEQNRQTIIPLIEKNFTVSFINSVQKTPVYEQYSVSDDNSIIMRQLVFYNLGVGYAFSMEDGRLLNNNGEFILDVDRRMKSVCVRAVDMTKHVLTVDGKNYEMGDLARTGDLIEISVADRWEAQFLWKGVR